MFRSFAAVLVRNTEYSEKYKLLGVPPEKIIVTGNIKHDVKPEFDPQEMRKAYRQKIGASDSDIVLVAGSTDIGEEEIVLRAAKNLRVVLAPRHLERVTEVESTIRKFGRSPVRLSNPIQSADPVFILDTMGELFKIYCAADIAFVGGSFTDRGGQNVIEPAVLGKPIVIGPNYWNFKEEVNGLRRVNAIKITATPESLASAIDEMLPQRTGFGQRAHDYVESSRGATTKTLEQISRFLV